jgi:probable HAF family extracellular repeat protein
LAVNNRGEVVGRFGHGDGQYGAFLWSHGVMRDLGTLAPPGGQDAWSMNSWATAINDAGLVAGMSWLGNWPGHAFLYTEASGMVDLNTRIDPTLRWELREASGINNRGQIVGTGFGHGQQHAVLLTPVPPSLARVLRVLHKKSRARSVVGRSWRWSHSRVTRIQLSFPFTVTHGAHCAN